MCKEKACGVIKEKEWSEIGWRKEDKHTRGGAEWTWVTSSLVCFLWVWLAGRGRGQEREGALGGIENEPGTIGRQQVEVGGRQL